MLSLRATITRDDIIIENDKQFCCEGMQTGLPAAE